MRISSALRPADANRQLHARRRARRSASSRATSVVDVGARLGGAYAGLHDLLRRAGGAETLAHLRRPRARAAPIARSPRSRSTSRSPTGASASASASTIPSATRNIRTARRRRAIPACSSASPILVRRPGRPLVRPPESVELDYEGEIVMVIGKAGRRIRRRATGREHVFGWTLGNEGTIRDWVRHGKFNVTPGKNWAGVRIARPLDRSRSTKPGAGPFELVTRVNGEERQRDSTARMTFSVRAHRRICLDLLPRSSPATSSSPARPPAPARAAIRRSG